MLVKHALQKPLLDMVAEFVRRCKRLLHVQRKQGEYGAEGNAHGHRARPCLSITYQVKRIVDEQFAREDLCLLNIARELRLTPNYIGRLFKRDMGMSFKQYLNSKRIEKSREIISAEPGRMKLTSVGFEVGYKSYSHFHKMFKLATGQSPTDAQK